MKKILFALLLASSITKAQTNPPPVSAFTYSAGSWIAAASSATSGALSYQPPASALYCFNASTGKWVPADSSCFGGGGAIAAWSKLGTVVFGGNSDSTVTQEPTVFIQPNPVVLTNIPTGVSVLGMFYTNGFSHPMLNYAESLDGGAGDWFGNSITIPNHLHSCEATIGGTEYVVAANGESATGIDIYSFASGVATLIKSNLVTTSGGAWKNSQLGNCGFWKDLDGHYYILYDGFSVAGGWAVGISDCGTSAPSSGTTCTDSANNPIISPFTAGGTLGDPKSILQLSPTSYEIWLHGTTTGVGSPVPTDAYFATTNVKASAWNSSSWTIGTTSVLPRTSAIEGVNTAVGQIGDMSVLDFNSSCLNFYTQFANGNTGLNGSGIGLAVARTSCENLATVTQRIQSPAPTTTPLTNYVLPFIDNLTGSAFSSGWVSQVGTRFTGTCGVSGGKIISNTSDHTVSCSEMITGVNFPTNQFIQAPVNYTDVNSVVLMFLNTSLAGSGVNLYVSSTTAGMQLNNSGVFGGNLATSPATCNVAANGDVVRFYNVGTLYTALDVTTNTVLCTATSTGSVGFPGIGVGAASASVGSAGPGIVAD